MNWWTSPWANLVTRCVCVCFSSCYCSLFLTFSQHQSEHTISSTARLQSHQERKRTHQHPVKEEKKERDITSGTVMSTEVRGRCRRILFLIIAITVHNIPGEHMHMNARTHAHIHARIHAYIHVCRHAHTCTCTHTYIHTYTHTYTHIHVYTHIHTHMYMCVFMHCLDML